ncbi:MAG: hypothetical protein EKK55_05970 [Rhodocyclaceae bacterium]|nr:MAG: hypothetical protein EKK55_05970 [Rhodocyclaceae bacterium]
MTTQWIENKTPATGAVAIYNWVTAALAAGFTKVEDSDGTTRSAGGTQVTSGAAGAGGLGNNNAYVRLRYPDGIRELIWQRGANDQTWRLTYSALARFTGGSPDATHVPSATDSATVIGAGTDASPTFSSLFSTNNTYRQQGAVYDVAPYGWWFACYPVGGGTGNGAVVFDPVTGADADDDDPCVFNTALVSTLNSSALSGTGAATTSRSAGWLAYGLGGAAFQAIMANGLVNPVTGTTVPGQCPTNAHSNKHNLFPPVYLRPSGQATPNGYKGVSTMLCWNGVAKTTAETYKVATDRDRISFGDVSFLWSGVVVTV